MGWRGVKALRTKVAVFDLVRRGDGNITGTGNSRDNIVS